MRTIIFRVLILFAALLGLLIIGTVGFMILEGLSFADSLYFTVVTVSTVGFGDIYPSTTSGKVLAVLLIIIGVGVFLGVVAETTQMFLQRSTERARKERINILIGVFFSEIGNSLLDLFVSFDPEADRVCQDCLVDDSWTVQDFVRLHAKLDQHKYFISHELMELESLQAILREKSGILVRLLENPNLQEHESFTDLLRATFHLREELQLRHDLSELPETELKHLANDMVRVYINLVKQWIQYVHYLKSSYPYLFSLALRTNPFNKRVTSAAE